MFAAPQMPVDTSTMLIPQRASSPLDAPIADDNEPSLSEKANVKRWLNRIKCAKERWKDDFQRMKDNMDFVAGLQHENQTRIDDDRYVVNMTIKTVNQRVATLYAKNPKIRVDRRKRLNYQLWDGRVETIEQSIQMAQMALMSGQPVNPEIMALLTDYQNGRRREQMVDQVCKTLETAYQYQQDTQEPRFKTQMKQLVRRVSVCGVAYIKVKFCREYENDLAESEVRIASADRVKQAQGILKRLESNEIDKDSPDMDTLQQLISSLNPGPLDPEVTRCKERLVFEFPQATSIIPDENCRMLRDFVGSHWVAEEFCYPLEFVNDFYGKDIKPSGDVKLVDPSPRSSQAAEANPTEGEGDPSRKKIRIYEVHNIDTKTCFTVCEGYEGYLKEPYVMTPSISRFWNIIPVTFNDVEVTDECKATIFPPSDVDLIKSPQKEHNRCRQALRRHRKANRPRGMYAEGTLSKEDLDLIASADDQEMIGLKSVPPGTDPSKVLVPLTLTPISPELYDTDPYQQDVLLASGQQEANIGPAQPNVTATVGTIAEQSRLSVASSDVDGLDDSLSDVAECGTQMMLQEMSPETIQRIVGPGAVWPQQDIQDYLNEIDVSVVAASSGRPNKSLDIANWERIVPLILQMATLPPNAQPTMQALIRETIKRVDDNLEPQEFVPLPMPMQQEPTTQDPNQNASPKYGKPRGQGSPMPPQSELGSNILQLPVGGASSQPAQQY